MKISHKNPFGLLKRPLFGILCLVLGIVLAAADYISSMTVSTEYGGSIGEAAFDSILNAAQDEQGRYYVLDLNSGSNSTHLYRFSAETGTADMVIDNTDIPFDYAFLLDFCVDESSNIYIYVQGTDDIYSEAMIHSIVKYDPQGAFVCELARYNYDCTVSAMGAENGKLDYLLYNNNDSVKLISIDANSAESELKGEYTNNHSKFLKTAAYTGNGEYLISCINGEILSLDSSANAESIFTCDYNVYDYYSSTQTDRGIAEINGKCYAVGGFLAQCIYEISDGKASVIRNTFDETDTSRYSSLPEAYEAAEYFTKVYNMNGRLAYSDSTTLTVMNDDSTSFCISAVSLPLKNSLKELIDSIVPFAAAFLLIIGIISCIGCMMHWHFTILSKMLWITIPVICIMIGLYTKLMADSIKEIYYTNTQNQLISVSGLSVDKFSGDNIRAMSGYSILDNGMYDETGKIIEDIVSQSSTEWSSNISADIYICADDDYWISLYGSDIPFFEIFSHSLSDKTQITYYENTETYIKPVYNIIETDPTDISAFTPIYDSEGNTAAMLVISASLDVMKEEIAELQLTAAATGIVFMILLILIEVITSVYIVSSLRKAGSVISKISEGDFNTRVEIPSKDELGEICTGVNNMAGQLQTLFSEKDKNEQFYYKFVPEKFRELLHKENFSDLALGDAESTDLTVLFCDIRSFSLNSEMMTAKENFEFANIIYGKAGPVIRRNNGFVDKYIGDAVMALFENADDAVRAGIELYKEIVLDEKTAKELNVSSVNIGIGIHSGMARIGIVGEEERMSGTVISNTVNLASRLESLTKQYNTAMIISKDTLDRMTDPDSLNTRYLGMIQVAGVNEVKALYEILDALDDTRRIARESTKGDFREAVKLFHLGKTKESLALFEKLKNTDAGSDIALDKYISYIKAYMASGDKDHNVFKISIK